jgi:maltooligosyltrehalose trehalohydrolase
VGNRAVGDRLGALVSPEAQRLACGLLLTAPFTPLVFMGEEYGERRPFPFFCSYLDPELVERVRAGRRREFAELAFRWHVEVPDPQDPKTFERAVLGWSWPAGSPHAHLRLLYWDLLHARRSWPPLRDRRHTSARIVWTNGPVLVVERGVAPRALLWANLSETVLAPLPVPDAESPVLSTAEHRYGGSRDITAAIECLCPWEMVIWGKADWRANRRSTR